MDEFDAQLIFQSSGVPSNGMTSEQKKELLSMFQNEFELSRDAASDLLLASSHLIREEISLVDRVDKILERSAERFERDTADSLLGMMQRLAAVDGSLSSEQQRLLEAMQRYFAARFQPASRKWT